MAWINTALLLVLHTLQDYSVLVVVFLQGTSDFCVSPDKFIVNQTKDFLSAGNLCQQTELYKHQLCYRMLRHTANLIQTLPFSLFLSPSRCCTLLFVLQSESTKPLPTGID